MAFCTACGVPTAEDAFCTQCGQPTTRRLTDQFATDPPGQPAPGPGAAEVLQSARVPGSENVRERLRVLPATLLVVCALMGLAGLLLLGVTLAAVPPAWNLLTAGGDFALFGLAVVSALVVVCGVAAGLLLLAWRMIQGDRVARGLSYVLLAAVVASVLFGQDYRPLPVLVLLGSLAAAGLLAFAPNVNAFFQEYPLRGDEAVSVVVARTLIAWWAFAVLLIGASLLPLAGVDRGSALLGLLLIGLGAGAFVVNGGVARGDPRARVVATAAAGVYAVVPFLTGQWRSAAVPVVLAIGVVAFLWVPEEAKSHFGERTFRPPTRV